MGETLHVFDWAICYLWFVVSNDFNSTGLNYAANLSNDITAVNGQVTSSSIASHMPKHILYLVTIQSVNCHNYHTLILYIVFGW